MKINKKAAASKADAKPAKAEKAEKTEKATTSKKGAGNLPAKESYKYDVAALAKELGIKEASARIRLRSGGIEKAGRQYGWDTDKAFKEVVSKLKKTEKE